MNFMRKQGPCLALKIKAYQLMLTSENIMFRVVPTWESNDVLSAEEASHAYACKEPLVFDKQYTSGPLGAWNFRYLGRPRSSIRETYTIDSRVLAPTIIGGQSSRRANLIIGEA